MLAKAMAYVGAWLQMPRPVKFRDKEDDLPEGEEDMDAMPGSQTAQD